MNDIAIAAGVSQTTVSMVLNDVTHARVSKKTRQRIIDAANAAGYSRSSRVIRGGSDTRVIGILIDEVGTTPFFPGFLEGADDEASANGCIACVFRTRNDPDLESAALLALQRSDLAGVIYATLTQRIVDLPPAFHSVPTVLLNCYSPSRKEVSVISADKVGSYTATDALLEAGHRRVAHLAGDKWSLAGREREEGYRQALLNRDIAVDKSLILNGAWTIIGGRTLVHQLLDLPNPPTAIVCFNDRMAVGAYEAIKERGLRIPQDISVVGFDDEATFVEATEPPMSTVYLPHAEMAREAVRLLLDLEHVMSSPRHPRVIKVECPLVLRESIGPYVRRHSVPE